eukprot:345757-Pelagomonas_calceolata.AAC.1
MLRQMQVPPVGGWVFQEKSRKKERVLHLELDCKNTCHTERLHPAKQSIYFQSMNTKPEPAHITHNSLRQVQKAIPRQGYTGLASTFVRGTSLNARGLWLA